MVHHLSTRVYEFTGLDYRIGLLDWTLKMWFSFVNTILRADIYSKCVDRAFREKSQDFMLHGGWLL